MATYSYNDRSYGNAYIDALVNGRRWQVGDTVRYYLDPAGGPAATGDGVPAIWQTAGAADALTGAMAAWNAVANIHLVRTTSVADADYKESIYRDTTTDELGEHYFPNDQQLGGKYNAGSPVFTAASNAPGGYSYVTFLHELGHSIGLDHPFDGDQVFPGVTKGDTGYDNQGDNNLNSQLYTVMSYSDTINGLGDPPSLDYGWAKTPMAFDIAAAQALYGANMATATGNDTYYLPGSDVAGTGFSCIWDAGGTDTISGANLTSCTIDLRAATLQDQDGGGGWLSTERTSDGRIWGGFTIAHGVTIENAIGARGDDILIGNDANNRLDGAGGYDFLTGGGGADTFVARNQTVVTDFTSGLDHVDYEEPDAAMLVLTGSLAGATHDVSMEFYKANGGDLGSLAVDGGFQLSDLPALQIQFHDVQLGDAPVTVHGDDAPNIVHAGVGGAAIYGRAAADQLFGGAAADQLFGGDGPDQLGGGDGDNHLDGGSGADLMTGGAGNDTYVVDDAGDRIKDSGGIDTVSTSLATYGLPGSIENLVLTGAALTGSGNSLANNISGDDADNSLNGLGGADTIAGGDGNDVLDGGSGADVMAGGVGNDRYVVDDAGDQVIERAGQGFDTVTETLASYALPAHVEQLILGAPAVDAIGNKYANTVIGNDLANHLYGDGAADVLVGGAGDDILDGGTNADSMTGGTGDDTYYVQNSGDRVIEQGGEGTDTVVVLLHDYTLPAHVENLLLAAGSVDGAGNTRPNSITGNDLANHLFGGGAADTLSGGAGDDVLDGGTNADLMAGGTGDDRFYVQNHGDQVVERAGEGTDTVYSALTSYTLPDNVENLVVQGSTGVGNGNALKNSIIGSSGDNRLDGGAGQDVLTGGGGHDTFLFADGEFGGKTTGTADLVTDWTTGDRIDLSRVHTAGGAALHFGAGTQMDGKAGDVIVTHSSANTFVHIDLDGDRQTDLLIKLSGLHTLAAADFVI